MKPTNICLKPEQRDWLFHIARSADMTVGELVRNAVDLVYHTPYRAMAGMAALPPAIREKVEADMRVAEMADKGGA
jgi:hypothetical protein